MRDGSDPYSSTPPCAVHVIVNPAAGGAAGVRRAQKLLEAAGMTVALAPTAGPGDAAALARAAAEADPDVAVIAAGGDGTIQDVVNGLLAARRPVGATPWLGLLPLGTANVLAWELGIGRLEQAVRAIVAGRRRRIHVGRCGERYFVQMAGVGFDARVAAGVRPAIKRRLGKGAYALQSGVELLRRPPPRLLATVDGAEHAVSSLIAANGRFYGGRFIACPGARLEDPWLELRLFHDGGRWDVVRYGAALLRGMGEHLHGASLVRAHRIAVRCLGRQDGPAEPVQADGEIVAVLPTEITAAAAQIDVLAPG